MPIEELPDYPRITEIATALWGVGEARGAAVMIGSGFSRFAELSGGDARPAPLWADFRDAMATALYPDAPERAPVSPLRLAEEFRAERSSFGLDALVRGFVRDEQWLPGNLHRAVLRLPWADVLTTNWDTLLERTADPLSERRYEPVLTVADIARTRAPRIVKLHGTFPSLQPFIFTEEDYRTYPQSHAAFVNLVQQTLLENELCLLGFSGDDPNFLAWSGWVRDNLAGNSRRIHLVGVLDIAPSQRRMLEQRNVTVIDLAPLVYDLDPAERHEQAMAQFLSALQAAKPPPTWDWDRRRDEQPSKTASHAEILAAWRDERRRYPGWLLAPYVERYRLRTDTDIHLRAVFNEGVEADAQMQANLACELVWRTTTGLANVPDFVVAALWRLLARDDVRLERTERMALLLALASCHREAHEIDRLNEALTAAEGIARTPDERAAVAYQRCLLARDRMDLEGIATHVAAVTGDDPAWSSRRALMLCELARWDEAAHAARAGLADIRQKRLRDPHSLWLLSREAWARFIVSNIFPSERDEEDGHFGEWPHHYRESKCDPWDEIQSLRSNVDEQRIKADRSGPRERALYDPGSRHLSNRGRTFIAGFVLTPHEEIRRVIDCVGLAEFEHINVISGALQGAARLLDPLAAGAAWTSLQSMRSEEGFIEERFSRLVVAQLDIEVVRALVARLRETIDYGRPRLLANEFDDHGKPRFSAWVSRVRWQLELLSRLLVRLSPEEAEDIFLWGLAMADEPDWTHWWLFKPHGHLLERALDSMPPLRRATLAGPIIHMPLVGEKRVRGIQHDWPELGERLFAVAEHIRRPVGAWDQRVARLISLIRSSEHRNRTTALIRMLGLVEADVLSVTERSDLTQAIWAHIDPEGVMPGNAELIPHAFLELDRTERMREAFYQDVVGRLRSGSLRDSDLIALGVATRGTRIIPALQLRHEDARIIAGHILAWHPHPRGEDWLGYDDDANVAYATAHALAEAVLPALSPKDVDDSFVDTFFATATDSAANPCLVAAAPYIALHRPGRRPDVVRLIRRAMVSRNRDVGSMAFQAVRVWARLAREGAEKVPSELFSDIIHLCSARLDPSLHAALDAARDLARHGDLARDDVERLDDVLDLLLVDSRYDGQLNAVTLTLVRTAAVRLADALNEKGQAGPASLAWLELAADDPLPEVRFAVEDAC